MAEFLDSEAAESEVMYCLHKTRATRVKFRLGAYAFVYACVYICICIHKYMY